MPHSAAPVTSPLRSWWRGPLFPLLLSTVLAVLLVGWYAATADDAVLPARPVAQLTPVPLTVDHVAVGVERLPVQANGYLITQTYDVAGPFLQPAAAVGFVLLLGVALAYFLAVVSRLPRAPFVVGMGLVIFLIMALNVDLLGVLVLGEQYFLVLALAVLGLPAYFFHAFRPDVPFWQRLLVFAALLVGLAALVLGRSLEPAEVVALHLSAFATSSGAVAVALLVVWVAFENVYGLLWLNTQADSPAGRFGLLPFLLTSGLYLGTLFLYYWNNGELLLFPGWHFDPYVVLVPAVVVGWLNLRRRAATYGTWAPYASAAVYLYPVLVLAAAAALGYAFATTNDPLLLAGRDFTALAFLCVGAAFLLYLLLNFAPLIRQKLPVYRVVYEPRRLPFYAMYALGLVLLGLVLLRNNFSITNQVQAGYYNNLGDLARLQSELQADDLSQALLAERYYAESDLLDQHNHKASLGRAALYRFRLQRQNEINILRRALSRRPSEKISLRLAALYNEPQDFFDRLTVLRQALRAAPRSPRLNGDLAQLYSRSAITDSVAYYQAQAEAQAPTDAVLLANRLAFLVNNAAVDSSRSLVAAAQASTDPALRSNALLVQLLRPQASPAPVSPGPSPTDTAALSPAWFAYLYHAGLLRVLPRASHPDTAYAPLLARLLRQTDNAAYHDQLLFLRAFTQQYGGRPVAAQATLLPLATGSGPAAGYYQQLQGLWLLGQQLPTAAANRLSQARQNGATGAALPAAWALALSNRPDSAARVAGQVLTQNGNPADVASARRLLTVLIPDLRNQYARLPDSIRTAYLVVRGDELPASALLSAAEAITTPTLREIALLAQLPRALQAGQTVEAERVLQRYAPAPTAATASAWNVRRGNVLVRTRQWAALRQLLRQGTFTGSDRLHTLYFRAALAEADKQPKQAASFYAQLVQQAPFVEEGLVAAADFHTRRRDYATAYNTLLRGIEYNPESVALLKAYVLAAVPVGLTEYATPPLEHLGALLSPADYATFRTEYAARRAARADSTAPWN